MDPGLSEHALLALNKRHDSGLVSAEDIYNSTPWDVAKQALPYLFCTTKLEKYLKALSSHHRLIAQHYLPYIPEDLNHSLMYRFYDEHDYTTMKIMVDIGATYDNLTDYILSVALEAGDLPAVEILRKHYDPESDTTPLTAITAAIIIAGMSVEKFAKAFLILVRQERFADADLFLPYIEADQRLAKAIRDQQFIWNDINFNADYLDQHGLLVRGQLRRPL